MTDDGRASVPAAAYSVLGHELRVDILRAFFEHHDHVDPESPADLTERRHLSYAELMDAVDERDSGRFNYHLDELRGVYVESVDDGYAPTAGAVALYRAVLANRPTEPAPDAVDGDAACPNCGATLVAGYEQEYLSVTCDACDGFWGVTYAFPKNGLAVRSDDAALPAVYDRLRAHVGLARRGQCPACAGVVDAWLPRDRLDDERRPTVELSCETCSWLATVDVLTALRSEPRVAAALVDLGVAETDAADGTVPAPTVTGRQRSASPFRAVVEVAVDGRVATVVIDDDLGVRSVEIG